LLTNIWEDDLLNFEKIGGTFTNLIKTLDESRVISIEAGFGRGKTFFRRAWAQQLRNSGEIVVVVDAQKSDHSGDPLITLLAALVEALPREEKGQGAKTLAAARKYGAIGSRAVARIALRTGADELIDAISDTAIDKLGDFDALNEVITSLGDEMSKAAGQMIAAQMAAERVRKKELPEQLIALQSALTEGLETNRVVIIVDELDRCHPTYAIAVLEAMKLVFGQSGFVFCLMVNAEYLERLAQHQFGVASEDEKYLDKFVDMRLRLMPQAESVKQAVIQLANALPLRIPFGDDDKFNVKAAAELAGKLANETNLSMRKIKRILLQVELAMRCYAGHPLDAPLLVFLAFEHSLGKNIDTKILPRANYTPEVCAELLINGKSLGSTRNANQVAQKLNSDLNEIAPELCKLPWSRYGFSHDPSIHPWALVYEHLGPNYVPLHRDALGAVADLVA
jgi:KAP family P-loop domain